MRKIYKYPIGTGATTIQMPKDSAIMDIVIQRIDGRDTITVYAIVDPESPLQDETFHAIGTGWDVSDEFLTNNQYFGTVQIAPFVWHIFKEKQVVPEPKNGDCPVCGGVREFSDPNTFPVNIKCTNCDFEVTAQDDKVTVLKVAGQSFVLDFDAGVETNVGTMVSFEEAVQKARTQLP